MMNILMIEDDTEFATLLSEYLAQFNIKITNYEDPTPVMGLIFAPKATFLSSSPQHAEI